MHERTAAGGDVGVDLPIVVLDDEGDREGVGLGKEGGFVEVAFLFGTVTEYRYKSDLDGSPIVSVTLRLADAADGSTIWQGTSTKMTQYFGSLSRTAQVAVEQLALELTGQAPSRPRRVWPFVTREQAETAARNAPPGVSHIPAGEFRRGKYEPDVEQIRRRGEQ